MSEENMPKCTLCPRECGADREKERGFCGADNRIRIARAAKHMGRSLLFQAKTAAGLYFFSGCSLACEFCQNFVLSHENQGIVITPARFYDIMFELKAQGAVNINLVTATVIYRTLCLYCATRVRTDLEFPWFSIPHRTLSSPH